MIPLEVLYPLTSNVTSFEELHQALAKFGNGSWCFRGQADATWPLKPKAGRGGYLYASDKEQFREWKRHAPAFTQLPSSDIECLALAQHHGLATRLLDWTLNPLVATYFAVAEEHNKPGVVHCFYAPGGMSEEFQPFSEFDKTKGIIVYRPRQISPRIVAQKGIFIYFGDPHLELRSPAEYPDSIVRVCAIHIPPAAKPTILAGLNFYGISRVSLFPDLDGLAGYMNLEMGRSSSSQCAIQAAQAAAQFMG